MEKANKNVVWYWQSGSLFVGLLLTTIGGYYISRYMGWIPESFPFWPLILLFFGVLFIVGSVKKVTQY